MTIKARLTLLFTLLVASILLLFCVSIYFFYDQYREQQFFTYLGERALTITRLLEDVNGITNEDIKRIEEANNSILFEEQITVYNGKDEVVYQSGEKSLAVSKGQLESIRTGQRINTREGDREIVMFRQWQTGGEVWVVVADAVDALGLSKLNRLRDILATGWLATLVLVAAAGWIFARDAIKPVADINRQVNNISAGNLHDRLSVGREKDELAKLAQTFNLMLDRLELAFVAQKNFVSHASHELRTPLAVMMADVEVTLMKERSGTEYRAGLQSVLGEVRDMNVMVNQLLELAQTEENVLIKSYQQVRLDEVLWQAQATVMQNNPGYQVTIDYGKVPESESELTILGDERLLRTAFGNLMENACKYSEPNQMRVQLATINDLILIHFVDEGLGISLEDIPYLFDPFYRSVGIADRHGYGIGLALTKRIVDIHKGSILVNSTLGQGSDFVLRFPRRNLG